MQCLSSYRVGEQERIINGVVNHCQKELTNSVISEWSGESLFQNSVRQSVKLHCAAEFCRDSTVEQTF
jgi:hypothetical protein